MIATLSTPKRRRLRLIWKTYRWPPQCTAQYTVVDSTAVRTTMICQRNRHKDGPHEFQVDINYDADVIQWPDRGDA